MSSAIRWVTAIRDIGVSGQDFTTIRRLRMINLAALLAVLDSLGYCTLYAVYDWVHFRTEISVLIVVSAFYPIVFLLSAWRRPGAAMWWLVGVTLTYVGVINWLVGPAAGGCRQSTWGTSRANSPPQRITADSALQEGAPDNRFIRHIKSPDGH